MNRRDFIKKLFIGAGAAAVAPLLPATPIIEGITPTPVKLETEWVTAFTKGEIGIWEGFRFVDTSYLEGEDATD